MSAPNILHVSPDSSASYVVKIRTTVCVRCTTTHPTTSITCQTARYVAMVSASRESAK